MYSKGTRNYNIWEKCIPTVLPFLLPLSLIWLSISLVCNNSKSHIIVHKRCGQNVVTPKQSTSLLYYPFYCH